jgi:transposase-like protein
MKSEEREIRRKRRVLEHAVESGNVAKTCRYFGVPRSSFYRWRNAYQEHGEDINALIQKELDRAR